MRRSHATVFFSLIARRKGGGDRPYPAKLGTYRFDQFLKRLGIVCLCLLIAFTPIKAATALVESPSESSQATSIQPYIDRALDRISEFTLDNGMKFIVMERHQAPVISFMTYVNVGGVDEANGKTGAAHYLEHLAFKGTSRIGTTNYEAEQEWFDRLDTLFSQIKEASAEGDEERLRELQPLFMDAKAQASQYVIQNQYSQIIDQAGGVGLNATTSPDETRYFYSFPSNKLELWMSVESERFLDPVFREFYEEKNVILEERRMRFENSPVGMMVERFLATAFPDHPYGRPVIGYEEDLQAMTRQDVRDFFETYYTPDHITCAVVGDVDPDEVKRLAEIYFGRFSAKERASSNLTDAPPQNEEREVTLELPTQPFYFEGYRIPSIKHEDHLLYSMLGAILVSGRTSRLYKSLIEDQQVALTVQNWRDFPGNRYSNLMVFYAATAPGYTVDDVAGAIAQELERIKTEPVSPAELDRVKTQWRASLLRTLNSNDGMASLLPEFEAKTGSWRTLFEDLKAVEAITPEDILRIAQATFRPENRTIGKLLSQGEDSPV